MKINKIISGVFSLLILSSFIGCTEIEDKNASRFAKRIFWASPVYGFADGVTLSQNFTFSKGVKSAAKQQIGETRKKR